MDNFNFINFNNANFIKTPLNPLNTQNNTGINGNLPQGGQGGQNIPLPQNPVVNKEIPLILYQPPNYEALEMEKEVVSKYLQNLMKLPETVDEFIEELKTNPKNAQIAAKIITKNLVNVKELNGLLNKNSQDAIQKVYETITAVLKTGTDDITQLKGVMNVLKSIHTTTNMNPDSIKEFLLLYLPVDIKEFQNAAFGPKVEESSETGASGFDVSVMIQTINFSNILCTLKECENTVFIEIHSNDSFPYPAFVKLSAYITTQLSVGIEINNKIKPDDNKKNDKQSFSVTSKGAVPINVLILSQFIIKAIMKLDNDFT